MVLTEDVLKGLCQEYDQSGYARCPQGLQDRLMAYGAGANAFATFMLAKVQEADANPAPVPVKEPDPS